MKVRIISSLVGLVVLAVALVFFQTPVFVTAISLVATIAVFEMLHSTGYVKNKALLSIATIFSFLVPFMYSAHLRRFIFLVMFIYVGMLCLLLIRKHRDVQFSEIAISFTITALIPSVLSIFIFLRDRFPDTGFFFVILVFAGAWVSDTGAYFVGRAFGKHKLAPEISPKKTIEGLVGGLVSASVGYLLLGLLFSYLIPVMTPSVKSVEINYLLLGLIAPICSAAGVCGDLFASVIKRQTGIKDYGNIMPGHGGVMDRFDSVLFVSPVLFACVSLVPGIVTVVK